MNINDFPEFLYNFVEMNINYLNDFDDNNDNKMKE